VDELELGGEEQAGWLGSGKIKIIGKYIVPVSFSSHLISFFFVWPHSLKHFIKHFLCIEREKNNNTHLAPSMRKKQRRGLRVYIGMDL
jgi:hypothetical protein